MPIIDSEYGIYIQDSKPVKICQYSKCPSFPNYDGLKLKACKKCGWVRYCCKPCQWRDWPEHKKVCKIPPLVDIGAWIEAYRWLFQWAAHEALGHGGVNKTATHSLGVVLIRTDRLVGPTPCHFFVDKIKVVENQPADRSLFASAAAPANARVEEIQKAGGLGATTLTFTVSGGGMMMWRHDTIELTEPLSSVPPIPGWQDIVRAVANGEMEPGELLRIAEARKQDENVDVDELLQGVKGLHV